MEELYLGNGTTEEGHDGFSPSTVMPIIQVSFALWLMSLIGFFNSIDKEFLHTFFDLASSKQFAVRKFRTATTDFGNFQVFGCHPAYYRSIKGEIKAWMDENYEVFEAEKPEWWTELRISQIPDNFIPKKELMLLIEKGVGGKRKRSVVGIGGRVSFVPRVEEGAEEEKGFSGLARRLSIGGGRRGSAATVAPTPTPGLQPQT